MADQADLGYIYAAPDGSLNWVSPSCLLSQQTYALVEACIRPELRHAHEAAGPQKTDAPMHSATPEPGWDGHPEDHARALDRAMSALHRQHTANGRPSRYLPEA